jgi:hypothetical protein
MHKSGSAASWKPELEEDGNAPVLEEEDLQALEEDAAADDDDEEEVEEYDSATDDEATGKVRRVRRAAHACGEGAFKGGVGFWLGARTYEARSHGRVDDEGHTLGTRRVALGPPRRAHWLRTRHST